MDLASNKHTIMSTREHIVKSRNRLDFCGFSGAIQDKSLAQGDKAELKIFYAL